MYDDEYESWPERRENPRWFVWVVGAVIMSLLALGLFWSPPAKAHSIYTGVKGKNGFICCGVADCAPVLVRMRRSGAEFYIGGSPWSTAKPKEWVYISQEKITFLPVPGEAEQLAALPDPPDGTQYGHFCGRVASSYDPPEEVALGWHVYCAFIAPGGV